MTDEQKLEILEERERYAFGVLQSLEPTTNEFLCCMNTGSVQKPGIRVLENGQMSEALDGDDFYSGCWGAAVVNFFAYANSGNVGVSAGLNNVIKTRDDERLSGGRSAETDFGDMVGGDCLD